MENKTGKRIKEIRKYLGLSRPQFAIWLKEHGAAGRDKDTDLGTTYSVKSIESWETGLRTPPPKVLRAIMDNVSYEGEKINWSYLNGESDYITNGVNGIYHSSKQIIEHFNNGQFEQPTTQSILDNHDEWEDILFNRILPYFGYSSNDIFDISRFFRLSKQTIREMIVDYINQEERGE